MTTEMWIKIISSVITIIITLISAYVIPYIKSKATSEQLQMLDYYVQTAVRCAEQIYTPDQWKMKKLYVLNYMTDVLDNTLNIKLTEQELDAIIEGVVNEIKH